MLRVHFSTLSEQDIARIPAQLSTPVEFRFRRDVPPARLREAHPRVYQRLADFYAQDPATLALL